MVGAPCGAMDQLTSALGQAGSLLALRCQPAEMLDPVALPPSIRLWGIDSGIRHRYTLLTSRIKATSALSRTEMFGTHAYC